MYEQGSGQRINMQKSEIFFSPSTPANCREQVQEVLGSKVVTRPSKYLGMPSIIGRSKTEAFAPLKERIWKKMKRWKEKYLSFAGREILIKAVVQAIPTYHMGLFKLPETLCTEINGGMAKFWWGHNDDERHIFWVAWNKLCKSKVDEGLGFRHLEAFNLAMLAKQLWRLIKLPNSLASKLMKARYYPNSNPLDATIGQKHYRGLVGYQEWESVACWQWPKYPLLEG
ncbi:hypothetical protein RND81_07G185700 [Saponaria officinalis]|uniref:Reverse transcriptase n=1 Tax=Saponaria officinalis TaxID=3572 RepID=A0AAW1JTZ9_SAPOF